MFDFITDPATYKTYFETIATEHVDIDGFIYGDDDVQKNEIRTWDGIKLWLEDPSRIKPIGPNIDNLLKEKRCSLWVGGSPPSASFEDIQTFYNQCQTIIEDIISRVLRDRQNQDLVTEVTSYEYGRADYNLSTQMVGCRWDFSYHDPSGYPFNEDKWEIAP